MKFEKGNRILESHLVIHNLSGCHECIFIKILSFCQNLLLRDRNINLSLI